ncbi:tryptophan biosynthesis modulator TrpM [Streptomyces sp. NPDC008313]|uniref:tryptophan biosynthesis modulator TrpM n=1 Tax=Streptomyces sp. NPDC008313 TaxID=3364826 RepID=UPI0036F092E7
MRPAAHAVTRPGSRPDGPPVCADARRTDPSPVPEGAYDPARGGLPTVRRQVRRARLRPAAVAEHASSGPYARLARGCRPRGCRAPARRVHGRRVRYVIGDEPGQVNGMRWPERVRATGPSLG